MRLESLDARVKLWMLLSLSTAAVLTRTTSLQLALLLYTFLLLLMGGVSIRRTLWRVRGALGLILSLFLLQCLFNRSGAPLLRLCGVTLVTRGGAGAGLNVMLRLLTLLLSALIILTGQRRDYLLALGQLGLPYELSFMVMTGLHFLPLLREESQDVLSAIQMRGGRLRKAPLRQKLNLYLTAAMPIAAGALRRSEQMSVAMEARAFRSMPKRTSMRRLTMRCGDWLYFALYTAILILILGVEIWITRL